MKEIEENLKLIIENENIDEAIFGIPTTKEELVDMLIPMITKVLSTNEDFVNMLLKNIKFEVQLAKNK
jgi:hypothetical protein